VEYGTLRLTPARVTALAFSPDGKALAVEETVTGQFLLGTGVNTDGGVTGKIVLNERYVDLAAGLEQPAPAAAGKRPAAGQPAEVTHYLNYARRLAGGPGQTVALVTDGTTDSWWVELVQPAEPVKVRVWLANPESDADFLRRVVTEARGAAPTSVEEKYFAADADPKKREKLLDLLLRDPAVAKKLGDDWKRKALNPPQATFHSWNATGAVVVWDVSNTVTLGRQAAGPDRLTKLVDDLLAAKKADDAILDAVALAVVGRLATAGEKALTLAAVSKAADRKAAWVEVAKALAATPEAKAHAAELNKPAK
jgi:hypothetical protein